MPRTGDHTHANVDHLALKRGQKAPRACIPFGVLMPAGQWLGSHTLHRTQNIVPALFGQLQFLQRTGIGSSVMAPSPLWCCYTPKAGHLSDTLRFAFPIHEYGAVRQPPATEDRYQCSKLLAQARE